MFRCSKLIRPFFCAALSIAGLQFRQLYTELVKTGKMSNREFHDLVMKSGNMPIEMVRALLTDQDLTKGFGSRWKFYTFN